MFKKPSVDKIIATQKFPQGFARQLIWQFSERRVYFASSASDVRFSQPFASENFYFMEHPEQGYAAMTLKGASREMKTLAAIPELGTITVVAILPDTYQQVLLGRYSAGDETSVFPATEEMGRVVNVACRELVMWSQPFVGLTQLFQESMNPKPFSFVNPLPRQSETVVFDMELTTNHATVSPRSIIIADMKKGSIIIGSSDEIDVQLEEKCRVTVKPKVDTSKGEGFAFIATPKNLWVFRIRWDTRGADAGPYVGLPSFSAMPKVQLIKAFPFRLTRNSMGSTGNTIQIAKSATILCQRKVGDVQPIPGSSANFHYTFTQDETSPAKGHVAILSILGRSWLPVNELSFELFVKL